MGDFYTSNGWKGEKYETTKDLSTTDIAKLIRKDIKECFPSIKVSVRTQYFSGGSSIDVYIIDAGFNQINPEWAPQNPLLSVSRYTERGKQLLKDIEAIGNKYNRSDCDGMIDYFDVHFYYHVTYDYDFEKRCIQELGIKV